MNIHLNKKNRTFSWTIQYKKWLRYRIGIAHANKPHAIKEVTTQKVFKLFWIYFFLVRPFGTMNVWMNVLQKYDAVFRWSTKLFWIGLLRKALAQKWESYLTIFLLSWTHFYNDLCKIYGVSLIQTPIKWAITQPIASFYSQKIKL